MKQILNFFIILILLTIPLFAQQNFGPYTTDANTVLLLPFDGDLTDASGTCSPGIAVGNVSFSSDKARFGQAVKLDNSGIFPDYSDLLTEFGGDKQKADSAYYSRATAKDTSYIMIIPNIALDLTGSWTLEGWIMNDDNQAWSTEGYVFAKGTCTAVPTGIEGLYLKKGGVSNNFNYRVRNHPGQFFAGYHEANSGYVAWDGTNVSDADYSRTSTRAVPIDSTSNPKEYRYGWLHFTFIRDAEKGWITLAVHNADGELVDCQYRKIESNDPKVNAAYQFHPGQGMPTVTVGDTLFIGFGPNGRTINGYLDELRISNVVRPLTEVPFGFTTVNINTNYNSSASNKGIGGWSGALDNQGDTKPSYEVKTQYYVPGRDNGIASASVQYHTRTWPLTNRISKSDPGWTELLMVKQADNVTWIGNVPQQPFKTVIEYYFTGATDDGMQKVIGDNHDWFHNNNTAQYGGNGRGQDSTYYRFIVTKENALAFQLEFEQIGNDGEPVETSEFAAPAELIGLITYPDDVPIAPDEDPSSASIYLNGLVSPAYVEFKDSEHLNNHSYTFSYWAKLDSFRFEACFYVKHNGSRWSHQQPDYYEGGEWHHEWWANNPGSIVQVNNGIQHYVHLSGDYSHPFWTAQAGLTTTYGLETQKWYKVTGAVNYTGNPATDMVYHMISDEDNNVIGWKQYPCRAPSTYVEGPMRVGHRGDVNHAYMMGKIDHMKYWNYFIPIDHILPCKECPDNIIDYETSVPLTFSLMQNYPNPFNPNTEINFTIPKYQQVELVVYDILGSRVKTIISRNMPAGGYNVIWDGTDTEFKHVANGMYFYRLKGDTQVLTKKMVLLR